MGAQNAKNDLENYRAGYPDEEDDPDAKENLRFYSGERPSIPDGDYIDEIHKKWRGKYGLLERHHGYIQWLFPIREHGMNYQSQKLQKHEMEAMKADPRIVERVLKSYELMLDFYGIVLKDRQTGELERNPENYKDRYRNLNTSSHNYLRITRILKCLGEMGMEHLKAPFLQFMIEEVYVNKELRNVRGSLPNYWAGTLRNDEERAKIVATIDQYEQKEKEERMAAGGGGRYGGGYGDRYGAYGGYRAGYGRTAANDDSSDDSDMSTDDSTSSDDEHLTVAERARRQAAKKKAATAAANAGNPGPAAGDTMEQEDEKAGAAEKEEEVKGEKAGDVEKDASQRCCQANESQPTGEEGSTATQELGAESEVVVAEPQKLDNHDVVG